MLSAYLARIVPAGKTDDLVRNPIGTGPYVLAEYVPGERTVLRRFDDYYDLENQAFLDEISYVAIPEEATKAAALVGGQIELANEFQPTSLPIAGSADGHHHRDPHRRPPADRDGRHRRSPSTIRWCAQR